MEFGIKKTAKALGLTREEIRRAKAIAGISAKAKEEAKNIGLDNNQEALLEIAKLPTPKAQCKAVEAIDERKRAARARRAAATVAGNAQAAAEIEKIEASIADKLHKVESLQDKVTAQRERVRKIEDELIGQSVDAALVPVNPSPSIVPEHDGEILPSSHSYDDTTLDPDCDQAFAALQAAWDAAEELREAWDSAPLVARNRFIAIVLQGRVS